jgi:hypothetical protein
MILGPVYPVIAITITGDDVRLIEYQITYRFYDAGKPIAKRVWWRRRRDIGDRTDGYD